MLEIKSEDVRAAARALQAIESNLSAGLREASRAIEPEWKRLVSANAKTTIERRIISSNARAVATERSVRVESSGGRVRNGLNAADHGGAVEFGVRRGKKKTYRRRNRKSGSHSVTRVTTNQLRPFKASGYVFTPAVKAIVPKLKRAWIESARDVVEDALSGRG